MMRVLRPSGLGAKLTDLFEPPEIMRHAQTLGKVSDRDAYRAWNMGQGMALITPEPQKVVEEMQAFGIEAKVAGTITKTPGVTLVSRGTENGGQTLSFEV
jgi:phosphoribosylformylglycinamidine cyclo-ligase